MNAEKQNDFNARYSLGKGEVDSSILSGSTRNTREIGTSGVVGIPTSAVAGRTYTETSKSERGESVDSVRGPFTGRKPMPLPTDITLARQQLRQLAKAHPRDERLIGLVGMLREQLLVIATDPYPEIQAAASRRFAEFEAHVRERGYEWPPKEE